MEYFSTVPCCGFFSHHGGTERTKVHGEFLTCNTNRGSLHHQGVERTEAKTHRHH